MRGSTRLWKEPWGKSCWWNADVQDCITLMTWSFLSVLHLSRTGADHPSPHYNIRHGCGSYNHIMHFISAIQDLWCFVNDTLSPCVKTHDKYRHQEVACGYRLLRSRCARHLCEAVLQESSPTPVRVDLNGPCLQPTHERLQNANTGHIGSVQEMCVSWPLQA